MVTVAFGETVQNIRKCMNDDILACRKKHFQAESAIISKDFN